ncbi:hypothetical protein BC936DRAFT_144727 [Jimgerdemannia flammicorona]|uniref:Uncharacterized protein n=1 Tax=Jimgerdemannia flammicorona TaxID=994334 RepID=A0A433DBU6_9FUNG|nr:hypothetical protein BC936DRAFT_144727 [Jimgerdemannia flammicorona]
MVAAIPAWSIPQSNGTAPSARMGHSAVMVGTTCFIFFGKPTNVTLDNGVYALDTTTFIWLTTYTPNHLEYTKTWLLPSSVPIPDPFVSPCNVTAGSCNSNDDNMVSIGVVIGIAVGSAILLTVALVTAFIYYRRYRNSQSDVHTTIEPNLNRYNEPHRRSSYETAEIDSGPGNRFFQPDFPDLPRPLPSQPNVRPWSAIPLSSPMRISSQDAGQFPRRFSLDSPTIVQPSYRVPARRRPTSGLYQPPQMLRTPPEQDITDERPFLRSTRASIVVPATRGPIDVPVTRGSIDVPATTRGSIDVPGSWGRGSDTPLAEEAVNEEARTESMALDVGSVSEEVGASAGEMVEVGEVGNEELRRSRSVHKPNSRTG